MSIKYFGLIFLVVLIISDISMAYDLQKKNICTGAELGNYAKIVFCLPSYVSIMPKEISEKIYPGGKGVAASMLLDGNEIEFHLLYPHLLPPKKLDDMTKMESRMDLQQYLEDYDPFLAQARYNTSNPSFLLGEVGNQFLLAYQASNRSIALILFSTNMNATLMADFFGNLSIIVNDNASPFGQNDFGQYNNSKIISEGKVSGTYYTLDMGELLSNESYIIRIISDSLTPWGFKIFKITPDGVLIDNIKSTWDTGSLISSMPGKSKEIFVSDVKGVTTGPGHYYLVLSTKEVGVSLTRGALQIDLGALGIPAEWQLLVKKVTEGIQSN